MAFNCLQQIALSCLVALAFVPENVAVAADSGKLPFLVTFETTQTRFLRLTILGIDEGDAVCLERVGVYSPGSIDNLALASKGAKIVASSTSAGDPHNLIADGQAAFPGWRAASSGPEWIEIELPEATAIDTIAFWCNDKAQKRDGEPSCYRVEVGMEPLSDLPPVNTHVVAFFAGPGGARRAAVTADRKVQTGKEDTPELGDFSRIPRVRNETTNTAPQWRPAGDAICLNGDDWWLRQVPDTPHLNKWPPDCDRLATLAGSLPTGGLSEKTSYLRCSVPGSVQSAILENGLSPQPWYYGTNARWLEKATVGKQSWFFKRFSVPERWRNKRVRLHFSAVDYRANYYLNGQFIGTSEGHFAPFVLDVTQFLHCDSLNLLAVQIDAFPYASPIKPSQRALSAQFARSQVLINSYGFDFVPAVCPLGISDDVYLLAVDNAFIEDVWIRSKLDDGFHQATLRIATTIDSQSAQEGTLALRIAPEEAADAVVQSEARITLQPGKNVIEQQIEVKDPHLWWPNGAGKQSMYRADVTLSNGSGMPLHQFRQPFGIRKLQMAFNEGHDLSPYPLTFVVNGKPIYVKSGGWVPTDLFYRMDTDRYERLLQQAKNAHFNMLRWWGGGIPERPAFYELCDRLGLMLFHDVFMANAEFDNPRFLDLLDRQAPMFLKTRRNHPSIVLWDAGNELFQETNQQATSRLWEIVPKLDPTRPFYPPSPTIGCKHAITNYSYDPSSDYAATNRFGSDPELGMKIRAGRYPDWTIIGQPNNEYYRRWIERLKRHHFDPGIPADQANAFGIQLTLEGGASNVANAATLKRILPPSELDGYRGSLSPAWLYHNARPGGYDWLQHDRTVEIFGNITDLETYVAAGQYARAQIVAYGLEEMRRRKFAFSGTSMWQYNEPWPNAAGNCLVDYFGKPRIPYDLVQRAYEPVHLSLRFQGIKWRAGKKFNAELWVTNDDFEALPNCDAHWSIVDIQGNVVASEKLAVTLRANASQRLGDITWRIPESYDSIFVVYCRLVENNSGKFSLKTTTFTQPILQRPIFSLRYWQHQQPRFA